MSTGHEEFQAPSREAFVVLGPEQTLVIPFDADRDPVRLDGWWVGALPSGDGGAYGRTAVQITMEGPPEMPSVAVCPSGELSRSCTTEGDSITLELSVEVGRGGESRWVLFDPSDGTACDCIAVAGVSFDDEPEPWADANDPEVVEDAAMTGYSVERYIERCDPRNLTPNFAPISYFDGVLYRSGHYHNQGCSGVNVIEAKQHALALRPGSVALQRPEPQRLTCGENDVERLEEALAHAEDGCEHGTPECDDTDACQFRVGDLEAFGIRRGKLMHVLGNVTKMGQACMCVGDEALDASWCSALDPCGSPRRFPGLESWEEFWVSTTERAALAASAEHFAILHWGRQDPVRVVDRLPSVLGVEYHQDAVLLDVPFAPAQLRLRWPPLHDDDRDFRGSARQWEKRCAQHLHAGRLDAAEAACFAGLQEEGSDRTRGALTYDLGQIEEERGDRDRALDFYRRSDSLRPENGAARARSAALTAASPQR